MSFQKFLPYLIVMAGVTYLIRMLPLTIFRSKIRSRFIRSFLQYVPYAVLGSMTFPEVLYSTGSLWTAIPGLAVALILAWNKRSLITVALGGCAAVAIAQAVMLLF